jgi:hypothetical protein
MATRAAPSIALTVPSDDARIGPDAWMAPAHPPTMGQAVAFLVSFPVPPYGLGWQLASVWSQQIP